MLERVDAEALKEGEEFTMMRWGNAKVLSIQRDETGKVFSVHQNRRWDEDFLVMKQIYNENMLGRVFNIESRVHGSRGVPGDCDMLNVARAMGISLG